MNPAWIAIGLTAVIAVGQIVATAMSYRVKLDVANVRLEVTQMFASLSERLARLETTVGDVPPGDERRRARAVR